MGVAWHLTVILHLFKGSQAPGSTQRVLRIAEAARPGPTFLGLCHSLHPVLLLCACPVKRQTGRVYRLGGWD